MTVVFFSVKIEVKDDLIGNICMNEKIYIKKNPRPRVQGEPKHSLLPAFILSLVFKCSFYIYLNHSFKPLYF